MNGYAIHLPDTAWRGDIVRFVANSALYYCTATVTDSDGAARIELVRPPSSLSSGERAAWDLVQSLAHGPLSRALATLDGANVRGLATFFASVALERAA